MSTILFIFGTRPEAIKIAPVVTRLRECGNELDPVLCSTGQHQKMLAQALEAFDLGLDFDLKVMKSRQGLISLTSRVLSRLDGVITAVRPDIVLVQGDTTSAMAGALAAYYHQVPVAHLQAGLRTDDLYQPFPEEGNRRLIRALAALHFAPTALAARRLRQEGVPEDQVFVTGNTSIDALLNVRDLDQGLAHLAPPNRRRLLLTMHRRESYGTPLKNICSAVLRLVKRNTDVEVLFPVHASPLVGGPVRHLLGNHERITLHKPLGYREFVQVLDSSYIILTDSGGIQEEAPALGKPVLVLREKTERPEAILAGTSKLVGTDPRGVIAWVETLLRDANRYRAMAHAENPYGDGQAAERVVAALRFYFGLESEPPAPFVPHRGVSRIERITA